MKIDDANKLTVCADASFHWPPAGFTARIVRRDATGTEIELVCRRTDAAPEPWFNLFFSMQVQRWFEKDFSYRFRLEPHGRLDFAAPEAVSF